MPYSLDVPPPVATAAATDIRRWTPRLWHLAAALVGTLLLVLTVRSVGLDQVRSGIWHLGGWFLAVFALGGIRFAARARAWMICAQEDGSGLRFADAFSAMLAADALGNLTPLGVLASEPARVLLVRGRLATTTGVSSVALDNIFYGLSVLLMVGAGTLVFLRHVAVPAAIQIAADVVLAASFGAAAAIVWAAKAQPSLLALVTPLVTRWSRLAHVPTARLAEVEARIYAVLAWPGRRLAQIAAWQLLFHVAAVAEVYLVLRVLPGVREATLLDAFLLESAGRLIVVAFKFVPLRLGVDEAGSALVARLLQLEPTVGVTLALVRKVRMLGWNAVGVGLWLRQP